MGTSRTAIKAPPQSLEALDTWGDLDKLPWSLDDAVWTTAGVYALSLSEIANSGQMVTLVRKKIITLDGSAIGSESAVFASVLEASARGAALSGATVDFIRLHPVYASLSVTGASGEAVAALRVRDNLLAGEAESGGGVAALRIRTAPLSGAVRCEDEAFVYRARLLDMTGRAEGRQSEIFLRVTPLLVTEPAESGEELRPFRVRMSSLSVTGASGEAMTAFRVRCGEPDPADAAGSGQIRPEYKGWGWRRLPDSNTEWRGIVEWQ